MIILYKVNTRTTNIANKSEQSRECGELLVQYELIRIEMSNVSFCIVQKLFFLRDQHNLLSHPAEGEGSSAIGKVGGKESASPCDCTLSIQ